jgi:hypothetical protein
MFCSIVVAYLTAILFVDDGSAFDDYENIPEYALPTTKRLDFTFHHVRVIMIYIQACLRESF